MAGLHFAAFACLFLPRRSACSARELAQLTGVYYRTILRIEHGQGGVQPRTLRKLAQALEAERWA